LQKQHAWSELCDYVYVTFQLHVLEFQQKHSDTLTKAFNLALLPVHLNLTAKEGRIYHLRSGKNKQNL